MYSFTIQREGTSKEIQTSSSKEHLAEDVPRHGKRPAEAAPGKQQDEDQKNGQTWAQKPGNGDL